MYAFYAWEAACVDVHPHTHAHATIPTSTLEDLHGKLIGGQGGINHMLWHVIQVQGAGIDGHD